MSDAFGAPGQGREPPLQAEADTVAPASSARPGPKPDSCGSKIEPGLLLGHTWIVEEFLGRGGMGEVWRCRHIELGTEHAVKIILPELSQQPSFVALFKEEARRLSRLSSDAIVRYEGLFRDEWGRLYLVMEFVAGVLLSNVLEERRLTIGEIKRLLERLALGLAAAHEQGILHRDISPDNIILPGGQLDQAKIIDFGIAKSLDPGDISLIGSQFAGKQAFVSPEQAGLFGGRVDARSDIYSLGLVLAAASLGYGRRLDMGSSPASIITKRASVPDLQEIPPGLRSLIRWMLQPDPDQRPQTIRALMARQSLRAPAADEPSTHPSLHGEPAADGPLVEAPIAPLRAHRVLDTASFAPERPPPRKTTPRGRWLPGAISTALALGLVVAAGLAYYFFGNLFTDMEPTFAAARGVAQSGDCALLNVTGARRMGSTVLELGGVVGDAPSRDRIVSTLRHIPDVARVDDHTEAVPSTFCPILRSLAALFAIAPRPPQGIQMHSMAANGLPLELLRDGTSPALVYVDAFLSDGRVAHLLANKVMMQGQQIRIDGRELAPTVLHQARGLAVVTAVAVPKLLLAATQPSVEDGARYAAAVRNAVEDIRKADAAAGSAASWIVAQMPAQVN